MMVDDPVLGQRSFHRSTIAWDCSRGMYRREGEGDVRREFFDEVEYASYFLEIEKIGVFFIRTEKEKKRKNSYRRKIKVLANF